MIYSNETEFAGSWLLENGNVKDEMYLCVLKI